MSTESHSSVYETQFVEEAQQLLLSDETELSSIDQAMTRVGANWLGYEIPDDQFIDSKDRGIDFWYLSEGELHIFQVKTHLPDGHKLNRSNFGNDGITDLYRARDFLIKSLEGRIETTNDQLRYLVDEWQDLFWTQVEKIKFEESVDPIIVNLNLLLIGGKLTVQAKSEYEAFKQSLIQSVEISNVRIMFNSTEYTVHDLFESRWQAENYDWKDIWGSKKEKIDIYPESAEAGLTSDGHALFYGRACDLVEAYNQLGYRIFELNVRAEVKRSNVNSSIEKTAKTKKGRRIFKLLNNGVTIVCLGYEKPKHNRPSFRIHKPGVINGLQTITALARAYRTFDDEEKQDFDNNCYVLVRLIEDRLVDVGQVVRSTNNQNPIKPRSLASNRPEQIFYEQQLAKLEWFYERKEGSWAAFQENPHAWRTLQGMRKRHFLAGRRVRKIDSPDLAQAWLAFVGLSSTARDEKRSLFEDKLYDLIFKQKPVLHAADLDFSVVKVKENTTREYPDPTLMLLATLASEFAKKAASTRKAIKDEALLTIPENERNNLTELELEIKINDNIDFLVGDAKIRARFMFVEFLGYLLFRALENDIHHAGYVLLANRSLYDLREEYSIDSVATRARNNEYEADDILCVAWGVFSTVLRRVIFDRKNAYINAANRSRLLHSVDVRRNVVEVTDEIDALLRGGPSTYSWARGIGSEGLYNYLGQIVDSYYS